MANRFNALTVVLEEDVREEDARAIIAAMSQLRGVLSVTGNVAKLEDHIAQQRARQDLERKLWTALREDPPAR